jgi:small subunit ribosomal protein S20
LDACHRVWWQAIFPLPLDWTKQKLSCKIQPRCTGIIFGGNTLANIKSQIKRNRQNEKRRLRNRTFRGAARAAVRDARATIATGKPDPATVLEAISRLDKAAEKGVIHKNNAARRKSRLMKALAAVEAK